MTHEILSPSPFPVSLHFEAFFPAHVERGKKEKKESEIYIGARVPLLSGIERVRSCLYYYAWKERRFGSQGYTRIARRDQPADARGSLSHE